MLARVHRIVDGDDLRHVSRRGSRRASQFFVVSRQVTQADNPSRFGFVVSKQVGGAVIRNRVKRRLREMAQDEISRGFCGEDVVVRALPPAGEAMYDQLRVAWDGAFQQ